MQALALEGRMGTEQVRSTMNCHLGRFLYSARKQSRQSVGQIAAALGISEAKFRSIEERPAEVPCCELYRLFRHYGPEQMYQAQLVLIDAQAALLSLERGTRLGLDSWKWKMPFFRFFRWTEIFFAKIGGRLCADFLKLVASLAIFR